jgi:hypothetical protein
VQYVEDVIEQVLGSTELKSVLECLKVADATRLHGDDLAVE